MKFTIIVDISILGFNAHILGFNASNALAKRCSFALCVENTLCIRYQLVMFFTIRTVIFYFFMRGLCVVYVWLGQTSVKGNTTNLERVLYWRWSDVFLASTFTRGKTLTFLNVQKTCAEVDAHALVKSSTNSKERPANHNALTKILHILVRWTCVMVCVPGPLEKVSHDKF